MHLKKHTHYLQLQGVGKMAHSHPHEILNLKKIIFYQIKCKLPLNISTELYSLMRCHGSFLCPILWSHVRIFIRFSYFKFLSKLKFKTCFHGENNPLFCTTITFLCGPTIMSFDISYTSATDISTYYRIVIFSILLKFSLDHFIISCMSFNKPVTVA